MNEKILIGDDLATNRIILKVKLSVSSYDITQSDQCENIETLALKSTPHLIILGQGFDNSGLSICKRLKSNKKLRNIPILIILNDNSIHTRLAALKAGANDVISKSQIDFLLMAMVRNLLRARSTKLEILLRRELGCTEVQDNFDQKAHIAIVTSYLETGKIWRDRLSSKLTDHIKSYTKSEVLEGLNTFKTTPDVFLLEAVSLEDLQIISELRSRRSTYHSVIIVQNNCSTQAFCSTALDLGADCILTTPLESEEFLLRLRPLLRQNREAAEMSKNLHTNLAMAVRDPLTNLHNRRFAQNYLQNLERDTERNKKPYAIMLLDLDRFKSINDQFGHQVGDKVLIEVSKRLEETLSQKGLLARFGGEEFLIVLPDTSRKDVQFMAEGLRRALSDRPIIIEQNSENKRDAIHITLSIGVVISNDVPAPNVNSQKLIKFADQALYFAKSKGRNRIDYKLFAA